jgi:predicted transcriptional regulator
MNDKWIMFKNYMHNELGITKEDIREWISAAVAEEAKKLVDNAYSKFSPESMIERVLMDKKYLWGR